MAKSRFLNILLMVSLFSFWSCDDFLDVNENPNAVTDVSLDALLPTTIEGTSLSHYQQAFQTCQITQQIGSYFGYFEEEFRLDASWSTLYLKAMSNLNQMIALAEGNGSPHYGGVARILLALNLGLATDAWENVPYTEAFNGSENFRPAYDPQEDLYQEIQDLLDEGIADLEEEESVFSPGSDDLAYGGDLEKWIKLAYSLKARYYNHTVYKSDGSAADALEAADFGFASNDDDFRLSYNPVNRNPWHTNVALANNTGNFSVTYASYFMDLLSGAGDGIPDPRIALICDTSGVSEFRGITSFNPGAPEPTLDFNEQTWYSTESAPILMMTNAELKFIQAEAYLFEEQRSNAYDAYTEGIRSHMELLGVPEDQIATYLDNPGVDVGQANLDLGHILKEKYIALFLHPESWTDMRRVQFDNSVYEGFALPNAGVFGDQQPNRAQYPQDELSRNSENVNENTKAYGIQMWRDE